MTKLLPRRKKALIWAAILLLGILCWFLGDVKRNYWLNESPDSRFSTSLVARAGWRSLDLRGRFLLYVTDNQTGETLLATAHPTFCVWERIAFHDIQWGRGSRSFICSWAVQNNGIHQQTFRISTVPLRVKSSAPGCGVK